MKVYSVNSVNSRKTEGSADNVQFKAKPDWGKISREIASEQSKLARALTYLGQNDGEILNTLVTAGGTAIVAPIFIAGNPISKEDKETKWYSAMRQPISAIIALAMQLSINKAFNNYMAKTASTGGFGPSADLSAMPKASYLKRIIKLEHPNFNDKQIAEEVSRRQMQAERDAVRKMRIEMKGKEIKIEDLVCQEAKDEAAKQLKKELEPELKGKNKIETNRILKEKITQEAIDKRAYENVQASIRKEAMSKQKIRELMKEGITVDEAIAKMQAKTPKTASGKEIVKDVIERLETIKEYETANKLEPFKSVKELGANYKQVKHNIKAKRLVKARTSDAAKRFSKFNKWCGIVVSLVTLPFSCGLLNWAYPRVMEKLMPKLQPWIHRNESDWDPKTAKKYGPPKPVEVDDDEEDDDD